MYQIASINHDRINISFDINSSLSSTGVDVNDITTSDKNLNAAKSFQQQLESPVLQQQQRRQTGMVK